MIAVHSNEGTDATELSGRSGGLTVLVAVVFTLLVAVSAMSRADWNVSVLASFGEEATPTREYAEQRLPDVYLRDAQGHDGKFFFVQANDPFLLEPDVNASVLDRPLYRSMRVGYPALAGGLGLLSPEAILWGMLIVNVIAMGVGTWAVGQIAISMGGSPWWGLAFVLNLGLISEVDIGGAGVVAAAAAFLAVGRMINGRLAMAVGWFLLAVLTRETMLLSVIGASAWLWRGSARREAFVIMVVPLTALSAWFAYVSTRVPGSVDTTQVQEIGWPFAGFVNAFDSWLTQPIDLLAGLTVGAILVIYAWRVGQRPHLAGWGFVGFAYLSIALTEQVWQSYFDITRAVAPALTSFVLIAFAMDDQSSKTLPSQIETGL